MVCFNFLFKKYVVFLVISFLIHGLFRSASFNVQICHILQISLGIDLYSLFLTLIFVVSALNLSRFVFWRNIWFILVNVTCVSQKNVCSAVVGCNVLYMPVRLS